jgi:peptide/nickel transport system substrate-binding protein
MVRLKQILKALGIAVFAVVFIVLGMYLFFEDQFDDLVERASLPTIGGDHLTIKIVEPFPAQSNSPLAFDPFSRQRLNQIYEPLIKPDEDLNMEPSLALSWGLLGDVTWEFNIRKNVKFHDGSVMNELDVIDSLDQARFAQESELKDLLSTIKEIRRMGPYVIEIETFEPDPLLLQRLSTAYVFSADGEGTGPYVIVENDEDWLYVQSIDYWDVGVRFASAYINVEQDKFARVSESADILSYVPYDLVGDIDLDRLDLVSVPSLEVQFLGFNFGSELMRDREMRQAVSMAINVDEFALYVGEYAHPVKQFVSSGVFGYNSDIDEHEYDPEASVELLSGIEFEEEEVEVKIVLPMGLDVLGDYLTEVLAEIGLDTYVQYVKSEYLVEVLEKMDFDIYFLGFKSELGDSIDFLKSIAHTRDEGYGQYNFSDYSSEQVDELIEKAEIEMDEETRLSMLQDAMAVLVEDDLFGVPLLEYETLYAAAKWLNFEPRIDGFIYLNDL